MELKLLFDLDDNIHKVLVNGEPMKLGKCLRRVRIQAGLNQTQLALDAGIDRASIWILERDESQSVRAFLACMEALGYETTLRKAES